jgi:hypothetical protein
MIQQREAPCRMEMKQEKMKMKMRQQKTDLIKDGEKGILF